MAITKRLVKGSPLTAAEMDANITEIENVSSSLNILSVFFFRSSSKVLLFVTQWSTDLLKSLVVSSKSFLFTLLSMSFLSAFLSNSDCIQFLSAFVSSKRLSASLRAAMSSLFSWVVLSRSLIEFLILSNSLFTFAKRVSNCKRLFVS